MSLKTTLMSFSDSSRSSAAAAFSTRLT